MSLQMHGSEQGTVEDLWCAFSDYLDRMHARADVAFNDATVQYALTAEVCQPAITCPMLLLTVHPSVHPSVSPPSS